MTIGAIPWVMNYNIPLMTHDLAAVKGIATAVTERGGGLAAVEASGWMAQHGVGCAQHCAVIVLSLVLMLEDCPWDSIALSVFAATVI